MNNLCGGSVMEYILETTKLTKTYGKSTVLDGVEIRIPKGSIFGLVGRNGAGKTTLMRLITGLQDPTSGSYKLCGVDSKSGKIDRVRRRMGALVETPGIYKNLTAADNLKVQFINLGLTSYGEIPEILELVGLSDTGKKKAGKFSLGMRQRLGLAIAMCGNPDLLILDEPINGLDPQGIVEMRETLIKINRDKGTTILISSHILDEMSRLATHYAFIEKGHIIQEISSEDLMKKVRKCTVVKVSDTKTMALVLEEMGLKYEIEDDDSLVSIFGLDNISPVVLNAAKKGIDVTDIKENDENLEGYFINLIGSKKV